MLSRPANHKECQLRESASGKRTELFATTMSYCAGRAGKSDSRDGGIPTNAQGPPAVPQPFWNKTLLAHTTHDYYIHCE